MCPQQTELLKQGGIKQKDFILTRDFLRLDFSGCHFQEYGFICPLPKNYHLAVADKLKELKERQQAAIEEINRKAEEKKSPFENILMGYHDKNSEEQKELLKKFKISNLGIDNRGIYNVQTAETEKFGNAYLNKAYREWYNFKFPGDLMKIFEPEIVFYCESATYQQYLLTSEFCIQYFNWLNKNVPPLPDL